ncbi:RNA polymerase sigma factor [Lysinibacillus sp. LZ02]|uniref:RNA polymerase sigma factor n=1 Tax=Lysinibacillus sp. LZ02 TaxID=3420668 RepID=UPI003D3686E6
MDFEELYERYFHSIYRTIFYMVDDETLAEDLTQETFLRVYKGNFKQQAKLSTYIHQIARNLVVDHYRRKALIHWLPFQTKHEKTEIHFVPHTWIEQEESRAMLYAALQTLKREHRAVVIYRKIEQLSIEETAHILGWSTTKVANTQRTAMKALERLLRGDENGFA